MAYSGDELFVKDYVKGHDILIQRRIWLTDTANVQTAFQRKQKDENSDVIPMVLVPMRFSMCFDTYMDIPQTGHVLGQEWTKDIGNFDPGTKFCPLSYMRISHIVNSGVITYSAPATDVPTADNILISIDVVINFQIASADDAQRFVYKLGANRLDQLLSAQCEESVRSLAYKVPHNRAMDMTGNNEETKFIMHALQSKLRDYGITLRNFTIRKVSLPDQLRMRLENTTTQASKILEMKKTHENDKQLLVNEGQQRILETERENRRKVQALEAQESRFRVQMQKEVDEEEGKTAVALAEAEGALQVSEEQCRSDEELAKIRGEEQRQAIVRSNAVRNDALRVKASQDAESKIMDSQAKLEVAKLQSEAMLEAGRAEEQAANDLIEKRKFDLEWERLEVLQAIARRGRKFITGARAESLMDDLCPVAKEMDRR